MFNLPENVTLFLEKFTKSGFKIYIVGGTIRGLIMKHPVKDWDFTTTAKPEEIKKLFPDSFYNNKFGTVGIPTEIDGNQTVFEVTTHRRESNYSNNRHPENIQWADKVEEDLARRDFTINAIAYDGVRLIDPYKGMEDIKSKKIKAVGDPDVRFSEDGLRILRAVRQSTQLGFEIEPNTLSSIIRNSQKLENISGERIRDEFFKLILSDNPAEGILLLRKTGILKIILPEVEVCFGVGQVSPERHHIYDVGTHLVESLRHCPSKNPITRFATLIHDIGKKQTRAIEDKTGIVTFYNHEVVGEKMTERIADRFRLSKEDKTKLVTLVRLHQFTVSEKQSDKAIRRFIRQVGLENIDDILDLRTGDRLGSGAKETSWRTELFNKRIIEVQKVPFSVQDLKIDGNDVMEKMGMKPGPKIGNILNTIFEEVDDEKIPNEKEALLHRLDLFKKTS